MEEMLQNQDQSYISVYKIWDVHSGEDENLLLQSLITVHDSEIIFIICQ
jgi:hypothetical protein